MATILNTRDLILRVASPRVNNTSLESSILALFSNTNRIFASRTQPITDSNYTLKSGDYWVDSGSTNLVSYSSEIMGSGGYTATAVSLSNSGIAPNPLNGVTNVTRIIEDVSTAKHFISKAITWNTIGTGQHAISIYAKMNTGSNRYLAMLISDAVVSGTGDQVVNFDLSTGAVYKTGAATGYCAPAGGGWYRCTMVININVASSSNMQIIMSNTNSTSFFTYAGVGYSILVYGLQVESNTTNSGRYIDNPATELNTTIGNNTGYVWDGTASWISGQLGELAAISNDDILTVGEKPLVIRERDAILTEQTQLTGQAAVFGNMSSQTSTFNAAVTTLTNYLATLNVPYMWTDLTVGHNTNIVGTTFRSTFNTFYTAREIYRNQLTAEAALRANWNNISNIPYDIIINNDDSAALGFNSTFSDWTSSFPDGWIDYSSGVTYLTKETSLVRLGLNSVRYTPPGGIDVGMLHIATWVNTPMNIGTFISGAVDLYMVSKYTGLPGILIRLYTNAGLTTQVDTLIEAPSTGVGEWQRIPFSARVGASEKIYGICIFLMASYSGLPSGYFHGDVVFDNLRIAFFDKSTDNKAVTISANGTINNAGGGQVTITGIGYLGDLKATVAGGGNMLSNSQFLDGILTGWIYDGTVTGGNINSYTYPGWYNNYSLTGRGQGYLEAGAFSADGNYAQASQGTIAVSPDKFYQFSTLVNLINCGAIVKLYYYNSSYSWIGETGATYTSYSTIPTNGVDPRTWKVGIGNMGYANIEKNYVRLWFNTKIPVGVAFIRAVVKIYQPSGASASYCFITNAMLCEVGNDSSSPVPFDIGSGFAQKSADDANTAINNPSTGLSARLLAAGDVLKGVISVNTVASPAGFRAGTLTWDTTGARTGGSGTAMTPKGLVGYNGDTPTFSLDAVTGAATFGGTLTANNIVATNHIQDSAVVTAKVNSGSITSAISGSVLGTGNTASLTTSYTRTITIGTINTTASGDGKVLLFISPTEISPIVGWEFYNFLASAAITDSAFYNGIYFIIRRNGTIIYQKYMTRGGSGSSWTKFYYLSFIPDFPGAGVSATYTVEVTTLSDNTTYHYIQIMGFNFALMEFKK